jgi:hypothetical protein
MADAKPFFILLIYFSIASIVLSTIGATSDSIDFGFDYSNFFNVTTSFTTNNLTFTNINFENVYGKWWIDNESGLYPVVLENTNWLAELFGYNNVASCKFGEYRLINNTYTEKFYLKNINAHAGNEISFLMYELTDSTNFGLNHNEYWISIKGNEFYIYDNYYLLNHLQNTKVLYHNFLGNNLQDLNFSYELRYHQVNISKIDVLVYVEDVQKDAYQIDNSIFYAGSSGFFFRDNHKKTEVMTNNLDVKIISNYQNIVKNTDEDLTFINFMQALMKIILWVLPENVCPYVWQIIFLKVPEFIMFYLGLSLLRGGS